MSPRNPPRRLGHMLSILLGSAVIYWTAAFALQRQVLFPSKMANSQLASANGLQPDVVGVERNWIDTDEGRTEYWLSLAPGTSPASPSGLLVFAHGNAELMDGQDWVLQGFHKLGFSVAMCEYRGYGRSSGSPSQAKITRDHRQMLQALMQRPELDSKRLVYCGRSVGSGVACSLAREIPPQALILISAFESVARMARGYLIPRFLVRDPFDNLAALREFEGPVLLLHGRDDTIIPFEHAEALQRANPHSKLESFDCGHNDIPVHSPELWNPIEAFLRTSLGDS